MPLSTDKLFARCLAAGGHRYGTEVVSRHYRGQELDLRICTRCKVPEQPRIRTASTLAIKEVRPFYERGGR